MIKIDGQKKHPPARPQRDVGITSFNQSTELGETLRELNDDSISDIRMSGIDMRSRLHPMEISSVLAIDTLISMGMLPERVLMLSRQKKRLSVSLNGKGRDDIVSVVSGKRDVDERMTGLSRFMGIPK